MKVTFFLKQLYVGVFNLLTFGPYFSIQIELWPFIWTTRSAELNKNNNNVNNYGKHLHSHNLFNYEKQKSTSTVQ